ncbi:MAG: hypothetical protein R2707_11030 [Acidimicrobiales bacterium]
MAEKKVRYTSRSLERHILASREHAWDAFLGALERGIGDDESLVETVLSLEPPWRRSSRVEGDMPLDFYERTFVFRDDGDECHLSCGVVIDPEPTEAGREFLDTAMAVIGRFMDQVVESAQA